MSNGASTGQADVVDFARQVVGTVIKTAIGDDPRAPRPLSSAEREAAPSIY
jgi:hypothetical protein